MVVILFTVKVLTNRSSSRYQLTLIVTYLYIKRIIIDHIIPLKYALVLYKPRDILPSRLVLGKM